MKAHLIIKTKNSIPRRLPSWEEAIKSKEGAEESLIPSLDLLLAKYELPTWTTMEYQPASGAQWNEEEIRSGFDRIYRIIMQKNAAIPPELIDAIRLLPEIEEVRIGGIGQTPIPKQYVSTATSLTSTWRTNVLFLNEAHRYSNGHPDITIAVLDTGVDLSHPELQDALLPGFDFVDILDGAGKFFDDFLDKDEDPNDMKIGHGTHVSGIIAAKGKHMPIGVTPRCKILPVRVLGAMKQGEVFVGAGLIDNINSGIKWAVDQGADIINMSLGIRHEGGGLPHEEIIRYALAKGVTVVAASGNDGGMDKYYPGALPGVIAVSACDENGIVAPFSTGGGHVSFMAPGTNIFSSFPPDSYAYSSGTSQAAPFVAGGIALLKSYALERGRSLSDSQVKHLLMQTTDRTDRHYKSLKAGYGAVNLLDAMKLLKYMLE